MEEKSTCRGKRSWFFTLNNYKEKDITHYTECFSKYGNKYIFQEEIGKNGTPHLQGCFNMKDTWTLKRLKELLGKEVHLEICRNFKAAQRYCCKEETRNGEIFTNIEKIPMKKWNKEKCYEEILKQLIEDLKNGKDDYSGILKNNLF